jgi:alkanesulfonate monooxygenase SsuD/methylene tetrahydromethanopterin reductase-like flavin-dependent oxidoreductase (luciferase family)
VFCADTEEKAQELGKNFLFGGGFSHFARPEWMFPPGYNSKAATRRLAQQAANPNLPGNVNGMLDHDPVDDADLQALKKKLYDTYPQWLKESQMITGTPKTIVPKLRHVLEVLRPGIFSFWLDGPAPLKDRRRCVELLGKEVVPALKDIGKELGLEDPFSRTPGSVKISGKAEPVGRPDLIAAA